MPVISEIKKKSPSQGKINKTFNPVKIANKYQTNGATCLSILTDEKYFDGSLSHLKKVKNQIEDGAVVFFEGGSEVRDSHGIDGSNMNDIKEEIGYKVLTDNIKYSASAIYNTELYNLEF